MKQFLIIGNSAAGIAAAEAIRLKDKSSKIVIISDEPYTSYCRCLISYYLAGEIKEDKIIYRAQDFYQENNIEVVLNKKVNRVDPLKRRVICQDKTQFDYDALLIATGASPKIPEIAGIKKRGVFGFRTIADAKEIAGVIPVTKTVCILGGGLVGLKAAYAFKKRNVDVKVIIKSNQVLSQMLDSQAAGLVAKKLEENGIELVFGRDVAEIIGEGDIRAVKLDSGKAIGCSLIVVGKGVSANIDLVKDTQIKVNQGIIADKFLRTNIPNIYAAGDVCESFDLTTSGFAVNALWPVAVEQGRIAGANMAGDSLNYDGSIGINSIEFFGLAMISLGIFKIGPKDTGLYELKTEDTKAGLYKKLVFRDNILVGAVLAKDIKNSGLFLRLIREKIDVGALKERLLEENFGYPEIMDLVKDKENIYV